MGKINQYLVIGALSLSSLLFNYCKNEGPTAKQSIQKSEKIDSFYERNDNIGVMSDYIDDNNILMKKQIINLLYGEYRKAIDDLIDNANIDWFINNNFIEKNKVGSNNEDLRELQKCFLSFKFYPIWSDMLDTAKPKIKPVTATTFIGNYNTILFEGDDALPNLYNFVVVDLNSLLEPHQKSNLFLLTFKEDKQGKYHIYATQSTKNLYMAEVSKFYIEIINSDKSKKEQISLWPGCSNITKY